MGTVPSSARQTSHDRASDTKPALIIEDIHKFFDKIRTVDSVPSTIDRGEIVTLLGPSGTGKTMTLDMVLGLLWPNAGSTPVFGGNSHRAIDGGRLSALLQSGSLLCGYMVYEIVAVASGILTVGRPIGEILKRASPAKIIRRQIGKCSGGKQQWMRFALALFSNSEFIILDEPTADMDASAHRHFWEVMYTKAGGGTTIIFTTHYLTEAEALAPRTTIMNRGKIVADDDTAQIRRNFGTRHVKLTFDTQENLVAASAYMAHRVMVSRSTETLSISGSDTITLIRGAIAFPGVSSTSITDQSLEETFEQLTGIGDGAAVSPEES